MMKKILLLAITVLFSTAIFSQTARVQVVHNFPDALLTEVDVYLNGTLAYDNFPFRNATAFMDVPAGLPAEVSVAPGNSTSVDDAVITETFVFESDETYIIIGNGIASETGYDPAPPLSFDTFIMAKENADNPANVEVLVHNGSTDSPAFDIVETGQGLGTLVDNLGYTDFQDYIELPTEDYVIDVTDETGATTIARYSAPLQTLNLQGSALTLIASGFTDPSQNSDGPQFGLFAATSDGGPLLALQSIPLSNSEFQEDTFVLYPNPVSNQLTIKNKSFLSEVSKLTITDMQGRTLLNKNIQVGNTSMVYVDYLATGMYQIHLYEGDKLIASKKIIKK